MCQLHQGMRAASGKVSFLHSTNSPRAPTVRRAPASSRSGAWSFPCRSATSGGMEQAGVSTQRKRYLTETMCIAELRTADLHQGSSPSFPWALRLCLLPERGPMRSLPTQPALAGIRANGSKRAVALLTPSQYKQEALPSNLR